MSRFKEFADPAVRISVLVGVVAVYGVFLGMSCFHFQSVWPAVIGLIVALLAIMLFFKYSVKKLDRILYKEGP